MNLLEAKELLKNKGYTVRRLNECGSSSCGDDDEYSDFSSFRTSCGGGGRCSGYSEPLRVRTTQAPRADVTIQDLLDKIPPEKKALVIQLLKVLLAG
jgi:hypothetical protein